MSCRVCLTLSVEVERWPLQTPGFLRIACTKPCTKQRATVSRRGEEETAGTRAEYETETQVLGGQPHED